MASDDNNIDLEDADDSLEEDSGTSRQGYNLRSSGSSAARLLVMPQLPDTLARLISLITETPGDFTNQNVEADTSSSSSEEEEALSSFMPFRRGSSLPKKPPKPSQRQLETLKQSDFCFDTKANCGNSLSRCHRFGDTHNLLKVVQAREIGDILGHRFGRLSRGAQAQISSYFLPNTSDQVASFEQKVFCGTYSACGDLFLSACQDQKIRLYDTSGGRFRLRRTIRARNVGWSVLDVALSPDNCHMIYSSWCDSIHQVSLFNEDESKHNALPLRVEDEHRFCIFSLRFSANGDEILCGANDGYLYVYDRFAQTRSLRIDAHEDDVNAVAFVDSATHILASGADDGLCKIWDRRALREDNPTPVGVFAGHVDGITFIDARDDERHIITNSKDQSIKLWDLRKFATNQSIEQTKRAVRNQSWDYRWGRCPDYRKHAGAEDPSVMTYRGHSVFQTLIRCRFSPAFSTGQKYIYTGCASGAVKIYDVLTGEIVKELKGQENCVRDVSWHPFVNELVSSSWDRSVLKWHYSEADEERPIPKKRIPAGRIRIM